MSYLFSACFYSTFYLLFIRLCLNVVFVLHYVFFFLFVFCALFSICFVSLVLFFFFFKQKTAYEMRISEWSSDVCSSDLIVRTPFARNSLAVALALALPFALVACKQPAANPDTAAAATAATSDQQSETARLNAWFDEKYEEQLQFIPIQLTFLGRKELYDQIDDMSAAGIRKQVAWLQASTGEMEGKFDYDALEPEAQLSWDLWKKPAELAQAGLPFLEDGYPFDQMNGMQSQAPMFMINFHKVDEESDYVAYVSRLRKFDTAFDQLLERGRASSANDIRPPKLARTSTRLHSS